MSQIEQIQEQLRVLPPEKQREVLDFVSFLRQQQQQGEAQERSERRPLREDPIFGSWGGRNVDGLEYQRALRSEWDERG